MKLPESFYNPLSIVGSLMAVITLLLMGALLAAMSLFGSASSYIGLFIFIILPIFLVIGLLLIPVGMIRRKRKIRRGTEEMDFTRRMVIDLNNHKHRNAILLFAAGSVVFLFLTGIGSYEAFHYTESTEFCGLLCHRVMEPEYVTYQTSSHARVACVECHVGEGADWFVKSKLSGLYQVYAVVTDIYPRPIPTPVHNLRPARETCERCHWPNKFYSYRIHTEKHFLADETNSEWNIQLKMKTGPEHSSMGLSEGIHWHINPDIRIEYISDDDKRESIPWVRAVNLANGDTVIYRDTNSFVEDSLIAAAEIRVMDCIDCHNRPSHQYLSPREFTDLLIASGDISTSLPEIKRVAMEILNQQYSTSDSAYQAIEDGIKGFYADNYPDLSDNLTEEITAASMALQKGYSENIFPEMKAGWDAYPNHIGHFEFQGCFRCHNGTHSDNDDNRISRDCNICHTITMQGGRDTESIALANESLEFIHPSDIGEAWKEFSCAECHRYMY